MPDNTVDDLRRISKPFLHFTKEVAIPKVADRLHPHLPRLRLEEYDGRNMRAAPELFAKFGATFDPVLSSHKGRHPHWDAFVDIMRYPEDIIPNHDGCVFIIRNAEDCLREVRGGLIAFGNIMNSLGSEWATPAREGQWWDRGPKSLHTVFLFNRIPRQLPDAAPIELIGKPRDFNNGFTTTIGT